MWLITGRVSVRAAQAYTGRREDPDLHILERLCRIRRVADSFLLIRPPNASAKLIPLVVAVPVTTGVPVVIRQPVCGHEPLCHNWLT